MAEVNRRAFVPALVLAPLVPGVPAGAFLALAIQTDANIGFLAVILIAASSAVVLGAPTYLTFGAYFLWKALQRGAFLWTSAMVANFASAPVVLVGYLIVSGGLAAALGGTLFHIVFGCIFSALWGAIFGWLYQRFDAVCGGPEVLQPEASAQQH